MPSAATTSIGYGKSLPLIAFSWGPKNLGEYSGNLIEQYAYLWVAVVKPDRSGIELYQATDSASQPWRAATATTGASYTLAASFNFDNSISQQIRWVGLSFSPSGRARIGLVYEYTNLDVLCDKYYGICTPPYSILKILTISDGALMPSGRAQLLKAGGTYSTGFVMLNTAQLHGRLGRAMTIAICGVYSAEEDGTRILTVAYPVDTFDTNFFQVDSTRHTISRTKQTPMAVAGYATREYYIAPANPIANPLTAHQPGGNGQLFLYSPSDGQTLMLAIRPVARQGFVAEPLTVGQSGTPIAANGLTIGVPGEVEIGELQYGEQGEGLKIYAYM